MPSLEIPLSIPEARRALARMYIDLSLAFRCVIYTSGMEPGEPDANLILVTVAVLLGHAEGRPMTASRIARELKMANSTVQGRLAQLIEQGVIVRIGRKYFIEPNSAAVVPLRDRFDLILLQAFAVLGPHLTESDLTESGK